MPDPEEVCRRVRLALKPGGQFAVAVWVRRCKLKRVESRVACAWFQRLELKYDKLLSEFAFNLNLRPYMWAPLEHQPLFLAVRRALLSIGKPDWANTMGRPFSWSPDSHAKVRPSFGLFT